MRDPCTKPRSAVGYGPETGTDLKLGTLNVCFSHSMLRHEEGWTARGSGEFTSSDDDSDSDTPEASTPRSATSTPKIGTSTHFTAVTDDAFMPGSCAKQEDATPPSRGNEALQYATDSVHSFGAYLCKWTVEIAEYRDSPLAYTSTD